MHQLVTLGDVSHNLCLVNPQLLTSGDWLRYLEFPITDFLAPEDTEGSHLTCFVGEGDDHYGCYQAGDDDDDEDYIGSFARQ